VDDWQQRGLATELLGRLFVRARQEGIRRFTALVAEDNEAVGGLLRGLGATVRVTEHAAGAVSYEITPATESPGGELQHLLRAVARGELTVPAAIRDALAILVPPRLHG